MKFNTFGPDLQYSGHARKTIKKFPFLPQISENFTFFSSVNSERGEQL